MLPNPLSSQADTFKSVKAQMKSKAVDPSTPTPSGIQSCYIPNVQAPTSWSPPANTPLPPTHSASIPKQPVASSSKVTLDPVLSQSQNSSRTPSRYRNGKYSSYVAQSTTRGPTPLITVAASWARKQNVVSPFAKMQNSDSDSPLQSQAQFDAILRSRQGLDNTERASQLARKLKAKGHKHLAEAMPWLANIDSFDHVKLKASSQTGKLDCAQYPISAGRYGQLANCYDAFLESMDHGSHRLHMLKLKDKKAIWERIFWGYIRFSDLSILHNAFLELGHLGADAEVKAYRASFTDFSAKKSLAMIYIDRWMESSENSLENWSLSKDTWPISKDKAEWIVDFRVRRLKRVQAEDSNQPDTLSDVMFDAQTVEALIGASI